MQAINQKDREGIQFEKFVMETWKENQTLVTRIPS